MLTTPGGGRRPLALYDMEECGSRVLGVLAVSLVRPPPFLSGPDGVRSFNVVYLILPAESNAGRQATKGTKKEKSGVGEQ